MNDLVARSTRAWIETLTSMSASMLIKVARSTRAWIETFIPSKTFDFAGSHALRVRGLKHRRERSLFRPFESHALRVRGLKHLPAFRRRRNRRRTLYASVD